MRQNAIAVIFFGLSVLSGQACAQQNLGQNPIIGGIPMTCGGAMAIVMPPFAIGDIARAMPGQILLDARLFQLPPLVQRFIYGHECSHQVVGPDENAADCMAIAFGKHQGWLPPAGLLQVQQLLANGPGDWTHLPGSLRIQQLAICYQNS